MQSLTFFISFVIPVKRVWSIRGSALVHITSNLMFTDRPSTPTVSVLATQSEGGPVTNIARCTSSGFYPATIIVTWQLANGPTMQDQDVLVRSIDNGLFSVTATFKHAVQRTDNGRILTCSVSHESLSSPLVGTGTIHVLCKYTKHFPHSLFFCFIHSLNIFINKTCLLLIYTRA